MTAGIQGTDETGESRGCIISRSMSLNLVLFGFYLFYQPQKSFQLKLKNNSNLLQEDPNSQSQQYNPGTVRTFQQITVARPQAAQFQRQIITFLQLQLLKVWYAILVQKLQTHQASILEIHFRNNLEISSKLIEWTLRNSRCRAVSRNKNGTLLSKYLRCIAGVTLCMSAYSTLKDFSSLKPEVLI